MKIQIQIICLTICIGIANNYAIANPEQYVINALELAALLPKKIQSTPPITTPKSESIEDKFNRLNKKETIENAQTHELAKTYKELKDLKTTLKKDFSDELKQALAGAKSSFDYIGITVDPDDLPKKPQTAPSEQPNKPTSKLPPSPKPASKKTSQDQESDELETDEQKFQRLNKKKTFNDNELLTELTELRKLAKKLNKENNLSTAAKFGIRRIAIRGLDDPFEDEE